MVEIQTLVSWRIFQMMRRMYNIRQKCWKRFVVLMRWGFEQLSPGTVAEARESSSFQPSAETGKSIMDMDTNEITISRIVGFEWDEPGTDLEDEMPTPVLLPVQMVAPVIPPAGTADPVGRGDGFDLDLAKVMLDVSVIPSMISPVRGIGGTAAVEGGRVCCTCDPSFRNCVGIAWVIRSPRSQHLRGYRGSCRFPKPFWKRRGDICSKTTASTSGSDVCRDTSCHVSGNSTVYTDDAADPRRQEERLQYGKCPTNGSVEGVCGGSDGGVHLISNVSRSSGRRSGFDKGGPLRCV